MRNLNCDSEEVENKEGGKQGDYFEILLFHI